MTSLAEKQRHLQSHIVVGIEARHKASRYVSDNASINEALMPMVIRMAASTTSLDRA